MQQFYRPLDIVLIFLILAVIAAIAIPNLVETKRQPSRAASISAMRTISSAQELFYKRHGMYATFEQLRAVNMLDSVLASATTPASAKSGYYFTMTISPDGTKWSCVMRPAVWPGGYHKNFMVNETGVLYWNDIGNSSEFTKTLGRD
jgi:Tfp pilus assembly protein PilE